MKIKILIIGVIDGWCSLLHAQVNIDVVYKDTLKDNDVYEHVNKFYFEDSNLVVAYEDGTTADIVVNGIHKLLVHSTLSVETIAEGKHIIIYPNPANDRLYLASAEEQNVHVAIYSIQGQLLKEQLMSTLQAIDISALSRGLYMIKIDNTTYKFSKL